MEELTKLRIDNYFKPHSKIDEFLCSAVSFNSTVDLKNMYYEVGDELIWQNSKDNLIEPIIAYKLIKLLGKENVPQHWIDYYESTHKRISAYLNELDRISDILASAGIPLIVLKNGGIAKAVYKVPGCVPMGDLDTLVRRSDFRHAHKVLIENGYTISAPNKIEKADVDYGYKTGGSEYRTTLPDGRSLWFELQWRPIAGRWLRPDQEPTADDLIERSISIPDSAVRLLCPEDNLIQVAMHTAKHSYVRAPGFRLHLDVDRIVSDQQINWDIFLKQVIALQIKVPVFFSLIIPKIIFKTPIPDEVLDAITPPYWKQKLISSWLSRVGLFRPHDKKFGKIGYILFTGILYDDLSGLLKGIFPGIHWMKERYEFEKSIQLPFYYLKRLSDLMFRRMST